MGKIDVTEILSDPDFTDEVIQIIREDRINLKGENFLRETKLTTVGVVQPASGEALQRLPDELRSANVKSFWLKGRIHGTGEGKYPDVLIFEGHRYIVQSVMSWTNWGYGWSEGLCVYERPA